MKDHRNSSNGDSMRPKTLLLSLAAGLLLPVAVSAQPVHPRLLFSPDSISSLRGKMTVAPFSSMAAAIQDQANNGTEGSADYTNDMRAVNSAFMYVLTADAAWASKAKVHVDSVINGTQWAVTSVKGLTLYMNGKSVALAYDMCYSAWDASYRVTVSAKLKAMADVINDNGGTEQNTNSASNWQGNRFSSAGLCYLATDDAYDQTKLDNCWNKVVTYCRDNMGSDSLSRGWNIEGIGYTTYPVGGFTGPFGIAMARSNAARDLRTQFASVRWMAWPIYAVGCKIQAAGGLGLHPDFGDDNPGLGGEGLYGQAFYYCHAGLQPGLRYWYDRMVGSQGDGGYDRGRQGALYGYLYYPSTIAEQDPLSIPLWRAGFVDVGGNGYFTYRNRYRDKDDMVAQLYVKLRGNKGHNGPDALSFRILGMDTPWGVGGGRYGGTAISGHDPYLSSMNTLYPIDPDGAGLTTNGNSGTIVGTPVGKADGGGHVIAQITKNNLDVDNQKRWFIADYSGSAGVDAVYVIGDVSTNGTYWQMCTLKSRAVTTDASARTFGIAGANGSSLKGWVLYQAGGINFKTGSRVRGSGFGYHGVTENDNNYVHFQSSDGDHLVVLTAAQSGQTHPTPSLTGTWPGAVTVSAGGFSVSINGDAIEYGSAPTRSRLPTAGVSSLRALRVVAGPTSRQATLYCPAAPGRAVTVEVIKVDGTCVRTLQGTGDAAGRSTIVWNGRDTQNQAAAPGAYIVRVSGSEERGAGSVLLW